VPEAKPETIWNRPDRGRRGPRPDHSRADIAAVAIALADRAGLAAASMRAVAAELGTTAGSLYRYLSSRDDLLALMVDATLAALPLDRAITDDWLDDMAALVHDQLMLYRRHPWLLEAGLQAGSFGPRSMDYFECCLRLMARSSAPTAAKLEAVGLLTGVVSLFARSAAAAFDPAAAFAAVNPDAHPHLVAALVAPPSAPRPDLFDRAVRSILRGLLNPDD